MQHPLSVHLVSQSSKSPISFLVVEQQFEVQDDRFIESLRQITDWRKLAGFVGRWKTDPRPWAQDQIRRYLRLPLSCRGHQPVVKQLFKHAADTHQRDILSLCLVSFDRLVRYQRKTQRQYDWQTRSVSEEEVLKLPNNVAPLGDKRTVTDWSGRKSEISVSPNSKERLFRYKTRYYLRRRAWRYFRWLGFREPNAYVPAVCVALLAYQDADLVQGEDILESWGLMHICFGSSDQIAKSATHVWLKSGATFANLLPAPAFAELWKSEAAFSQLWNLLCNAASRMVRAWAIGMIESVHRERLSTVSVEDLVQCLTHDDEAVAEFGARWFSSCPQLAKLTIDRWLNLLKFKNPAAIDAVCRAMSQHVHSDRLSFSHCVELACAAPVSVARMGLDWLRLRTPESDADRESLKRAGHSKCVALGGELATWVLSQVGTPQCYLREHASALLDSLNSGCRQGAWKWLVAPESPGRNDPVLWSRLIESPHDDIQLPLVQVLNQRSIPIKPSQARAVSRIHTGLSAADLTPVWSRILCHVHRGGRQKLLAISQIKDAVLQNREQFETLLPVLRVAVRSVRGPERAAGLSAVLEIAAQFPELEPQLRQEFPELKLIGEGA